MHITVEQALSIYPLSEGKLIAGTEGTSRIVKSVNVMDAPDITDWIKDGEMLFTTAYLMKDNPEEAIQLLRTLNKRGSAGLGIKLGRF
ncbi:PucR family transcriptional regulator ligand-binding domain-containing protein [Paenibacillus sp. TAB 01]|uniref:PucR family transcriptional regulator ligand-binding domain-containing protein n=1 Tax=Paenibacillus sp. TAB 01 TaxID=3368988 RepID=UPI003751995D